MAEAEHDMIQERHIRILRQLVLGHGVGDEQARSTLGYFLMGNGRSVDIFLYGATPEILAMIAQRVKFEAPLDPCVVCHKKTEFSILTPVDERARYTDAGQLCESCYIDIFSVDG